MLDKKILNLIFFGLTIQLLVQIFFFKFEKYYTEIIKVFDLVGGFEYHVFLFPKLQCVRCMLLELDVGKSGHFDDSNCQLYW